MFVDRRAGRVACVLLKLETIVTPRYVRSTMLHDGRGTPWLQVVSTDEGVSQAECICLQDEAAKQSSPVGALNLPVSVCVGVIATLEAGADGAHKKLG